MPQLQRRTAGSFLRGLAVVFTVFVIVSLSGCVQVPISAEMILQPKPSVTPGSFSHPTASLEEFFFTAEDGTSINAWYLSQPEAESTVLFFGGYGFYLVQSNDYLDAFLRNNVNAMMWDYRGYGRSGGEPTVERMKADALRAYEVLRERYNTDPSEIVLHGHSLGSFVASYVAHERPVAGVVLESPITEPEDWTKTVVPWYLRLLLRFNIAEEVADEDNRRRLAEVKAPLLLLAGGEDFVAPAALAEELHERAGSSWKELTVIEEGSHSDLMTFPAYDRDYRRLLEQARQYRIGAEDEG
jgi:hypothetical protein